MMTFKHFSTPRTCQNHCEEEEFNKNILLIIRNKQRDEAFYDLRDGSDKLMILAITTKTDCSDEGRLQSLFGVRLMM